MLKNMKIGKRLGLGVWPDIAAADRNRGGRILEHKDDIGIEHIDAPR